MKGIMSVLAMFCLAASVHSQSLKQPADVKNLTDTVMQEVSTENYTSGLDVLKQYSILSSAEIDTIESNLKAQMPKVEPSYGKIVGVEYIAQKQIGISLLNLTYLLKMERYALRWTFSFYNGGAGWNLIFIDYNDKLQDMFSNSLSN